MGQGSSEQGIDWVNQLLQLERYRHLYRQRHLGITVGMDVWPIRINMAMIDVVQRHLIVMENNNMGVVTMEDVSHHGDGRGGGVVAADDLDRPVIALVIVIDDQEGQRTAGSRYVAQQRAVRHLADPGPELLHQWTTIIVIQRTNDGGVYRPAVRVRRLLAEVRHDHGRDGPTIIAHPMGIGVSGNQLYRYLLLKKAKMLKYF